MPNTPDLDPRTAWLDQKGLERRPMVVLEAFARVRCLDCGDWSRNPVCDWCDADRLNDLMRTHYNMDRR